ncbi:hypothetical protein MP228_002853 [Amoeboaphelidium protococcarum]|nr:hypothetical protein MP228_002853 [Amoeboaphelidium protococcarum]
MLGADKQTQQSKYQHLSQSVQDSSLHLSVLCAMQALVKCNCYEKLNQLLLWQAERSENLIRNGCANALAVVLDELLHRAVDTQYKQSQVNNNNNINSRNSSMSSLDLTIQKMKNVDLNQISEYQLNDIIGSLYQTYLKLKQSSQNRQMLDLIKFDYEATGSQFQKEVYLKLLNEAIQPVVKSILAVLSGQSYSFIVQDFQCSLFPQQVLSQVQDIQRLHNMLQGSIQPGELQYSILRSKQQRFDQSNLDQLFKTVKDQYQRLNSKVLGILFKECQLIQKFNDIVIKYFMMDSVEVIKWFQHDFTDIMLPNGRIGLYQYLGGDMIYDCGSSLSEMLFLMMGKQSSVQQQQQQNQQRYFQRLGLRMKVEGPLEVLFPLNAFRSYDLVFRQMLYINASIFAVSNLLSEVNDSLQRDTWLALSTLLQALSVIQNHIADQLKSHVQQFQSQLIQTQQTLNNPEKVASLSQLQISHHRFLSDCLDSALVTDIDLVSVVHQLFDQCFTFIQEYGKAVVIEKDIMSTAQQSNQTIKALVELLRKLTAAGGELHLAMLFDRLSCIINL